MDNLYEKAFKENKSLEESSVFINRLNDDDFFLYCFSCVSLKKFEKEIGRFYIQSRIYDLIERGFLSDICSGFTKL